jgi:hypothetical protein
MSFEDTATFQRLDILADVCFSVMTGQLTPVRDLLDDHKFTLRVLKHPIRVIKASQIKQHSFHPFIQYTAPPSIKVKRKRASSWQLAILRDAFIRCQFPSVEERRHLGESVGMTERAVQIWFQNSRQAVKAKYKLG